MPTWVAGFFNFCMRPNVMIAWFAGRFLGFVYFWAFRIYIYIYTFIYVYIYIYICYIHVYTCICIYIFICTHIIFGVIKSVCFFCENGSQFEVNEGRGPQFKYNFIFPRGSKKRDSSNDDAHVHGQKQRNPSTCLERKAKLDKSFPTRP